MCLEKRGGAVLEFVPTRWGSNDLTEGRLCLWRNGGLEEAMYIYIYYIIYIIYYIYIIYMYILYMYIIYRYRYMYLQERSTVDIWRHPK